MNAVILAAGFGRRLLPLTKDIPKPLLKVRGKNLIDYHIESLSKAGIGKIIINKILFPQSFPQIVHDVRASHYESGETLELRLCGKLKNFLSVNSFPRYGIKREAFF